MADTNPTLHHAPVAPSEYRALLDAHAAVGPPIPNPKPVTTYEHIPHNAPTESILERLRGPVPLTEVELPASDRPRPYWIPNQAAIWEERNAAAQRIETLERELVSARKQEASPDVERSKMEEMFAANEHPEDPHYHERFGFREPTHSPTQKQDGLSALDGTSRELVAAAANAIEKVDWFYDRSPDPTVRSEGFKHMRAAVHSLDAVVTHGDNLRVEYAMDAVDAVKQHTLRTEAASAIWQHHAPKMASETREYYRPDWFYSDSLHAHSWDMGKIADMGREYRAAHDTTQAERDAARATASPALASDAQSAGVGEIMRAALSAGL